MRRGLFWAGVVLGVVLLVGGSTLALLGWAETSGPGGAVRGYFAALARGDAPDALAFGDLPDGRRVLLTSEVLAAQQRIAPMRHFTITDTNRTGDAARVSVRYVLAFPSSAQTVNATVGVHRAEGSWRLDRAAVPTSLSLDRAGERAGVLGGEVPDGDVLLFPGAVPVTFDTPYLQLVPAEDSVGFGSGPDTTVFVEVSPAGKKAAVAAVRSALGDCLAGRGDAACPLPDERYVPGSIRGRTTRPVADAITVRLSDSDEGLLELTGHQPVAATSYRRLTFTNRAVNGSGRVTLDVNARAYAVAPLRLSWRRA